MLNKVENDDRLHVSSLSSNLLVVFFDFGGLKYLGQLMFSRALMGYITLGTYVFVESLAFSGRLDHANADGKVTEALAVVALSGVALDERLKDA